jgi:lactosylceramide 4-alpha-galactosyltransferase
VFVRDELSYAQEGEHWYSHETDLLRLLILYKFGGIYLDIDMIIVRELHELPPNIIGWESGMNLNGAFLKFRKHHPYLHECIKRFSNRYSQAWSDNGPLLLSRVWRKWSAENPSNDVTTVARATFYMFFYRGIQEQCFEETSGPVFNMNWRTLRRHAYAVHLYSKVTARYGDNGAKIKDGTLCKYILNAFCVLCIKVY